MSQFPVYVYAHCVFKCWPQADITGGRPLQEVIEERQEAREDNQVARYEHLNQEKMVILLLSLL